VRSHRELSDEDVKLQAEACWRYLRKPGSRGASFWCSSKGFGPADRAAVLMALGEIDEADMVDPVTSIASDAEVS